MTAQTNGQMLIGQMQDQGGRPNMEDNIEVRPLRTALGLPLLVAMVADGIGGNNCGEVASQLAIETVFNEMAKAAVENAEQIPQLLAYALKQANEAVYRAAKADKSKEGMGTTATLAAIHNNKLYLANVGDSRAYLVRDGRAQQITVDHTWAREMVRLGHLSVEDAAAHPKGEALVRSIGYGERLEVDLGIYPDGDEEERQARTRQGFPLQTNDRLLLCSDGLVKDRYKASGHYVEPNEIVQIISRNHAEKAAQALVKKAVSRQADDNVSAIVLEMPGSQVAAGMPRGVIIGAAVLLLLLAIGAGAFALLSGRQTVAEATAVPLPPTDVPVVVVPTATAVPEMEVSEAGADLLLQPGLEGVTWAIGDGERQPAKDPATLQFAASDLLTLVNGRTAAADRPNITNLILPAQVQLFLDGETEMTLTAVQGVQDSDETRVRLENGLLLVEMPEGEASRVVIVSAIGDEAWLENPGLMVVQYQDDPFTFMVACLEAEGYCRLTYDDSPYDLVAGQYICFGNCPVVAAIQPVDIGEYAYLAPGLIVVATAVPTATDTSTPTATNTRRPTTPRPGEPTVTATATTAVTPTSDNSAPPPPPGATATNVQPPTLTNTPPPGTTATNTPPPTNTPPATNTPRPSTSTPRPPTSTPQPPTNTPVPPTNTPQPPTNTPIPPTSTPQPPTATPEPPTATPEPPTDTPPPPPTDTPYARPTDTSAPQP